MTKGDKELLLVAIAVIVGFSSLIYIMVTAGRSSDVGAREDRKRVQSAYHSCMNKEIDINKRKYIIATSLCERSNPDMFTK